MRDSVKIRNLSKFTKSLAKDVCYHLDIKLKDLKHYMTFTQAKNLVREFCEQENHCYRMSRKSFNECASQMTSWIINFELAKLASDGKFECYVDEEGNFETECVGGDDDLA